MPYYALTSELTDDYDERCSLTIYRMVMASQLSGGRRIHPGDRGSVRRAAYRLCFYWYCLRRLGSLALLISAAGFRERKKVSESKAEASPSNR